MTSLLQQRFVPVRRALLVSGLLAGCVIPGLAAAGTSVMVNGRVVAQAGAYLSGSAAARAGDYETAVGYLTAAYQAEPTNMDLAGRAFLALVDLGRIEEAAPIARALLESDPKIAVAPLVLALDAMKRGDYAAAKPLVEGMVPAGVNTIIAPLLAAWLAAAAHDAPGVAKALAPLNESTGAASLRDFHAALAAEALGDEPGALANYRAMLEKDGAPPLRLVEAAGAAFERSGDAAAAKALYDRFDASGMDADYLKPALDRLASGAKPGPTVVTPLDGMAQAMFDVASIVQRQQSGADMGLIAIRLTLFLKPDFPLARMLLAEILEGSGNYAGAVAAYDAVPKSSPLSWSARLRAALNRDAEGEADRAIADLRAMTTERPERGDAPARLGDILRGHDRFAEAVAPYELAVKRLGEIHPADWSLFFDRAISYERTHDIEKATADLKKALELRPDEPYVMNYLGYTWVEHGLHLDEAMKLIRKAVELRPTDGSIVDSLGWAHYQLGDFKAAVRELERAIELRPQDPTINDHLGDAYWRVGRKVEARFQWHRAINLDTANEIKSGVEKKLVDGLPPPSVTTSAGQPL